MHKTYYLLLLIFTLQSCTSQNQEIMNKKANDLLQETSPYLLQHAYNPVAWRPWNSKALEKAKKENKLLLISVGYSACHWCHVMEEESFEDEEVAAFMNANFINIKVDREERPDVDQVYMDAVQAITGRGGWPLNCFALPDGRPVYGGTYFPKEQWLDVLKQLAKMHRENPEKVLEYANQLEEGIKANDLIKTPKENTTITRDKIKSGIVNWTKRIDETFGGPNRSPKFPMPNSYEYLLQYSQQYQDETIAKHVYTSLDKMALGGINDQIGGGFARYSVDKKWHVPHFEKMLYDNGQLVSLYAKAYALSKKELYKNTVYETLAYIKEEMLTNEGGFYSALDADSETDHGELEEGAYYVWSKEHLQELLGDDFPLFSEYYNINAYGKWEESYVLIRKESQEAFRTKHALTEKGFQDKVMEWKSILSKERAKRKKPRLDDKILTGWNALMLTGYIDAYKVFEEPEFLKIALQSANFIDAKLSKTDGGLYRTYKKGSSKINAYLEDYAALIYAYIQLYEVTFDPKWLFAAKKYTEYCLEYFKAEDSPFFYFTSALDDALVSRKTDIHDNVIPASNSIMGINLFLLSHHFEEKKYKNIALEMTKYVIDDASKHGSNYANWLRLATFITEPYYEIAIVGSNVETLRKGLQKEYLPNIMYSGSRNKSDLPLLKNRYNEEETLIYICANGACKVPVKNIVAALKQLEQ